MQMKQILEALKKSTKEEKGILIEGADKYKVLEELNEAAAQFYGNDRCAAWVEGNFGDAFREDPFNEEAYEESTSPGYGLRS